MVVGYHLSRLKDQCGGLGITETHDDSRKPLGIVLGETSIVGDLGEIQFRTQIDRGHHILYQGWVGLVENFLSHSLQTIHYLQLGVGEVTVHAIHLIILLVENQLFVHDYIIINYVVKTHTA